MSDKHYTVTGMTCGHCANAVQTEVKSVAGVESAAVDLATGRLVVVGDGFTDEQIAAAVDEAGYTVAAA